MRGALHRVGVEPVARRGLAGQRPGDVLRHVRAPHRGAVDQERAADLGVAEVDPGPLDRHVDGDGHGGCCLPTALRARCAPGRRLRSGRDRTPRRRPRPSRCAAWRAGTARRGPRTGRARRSGRGWRARRRAPRPRRGLRRARRAGRRRGPAARRPHRRDTRRAGAEHHHRIRAQPQRPAQPGDLGRAAVGAVGEHREPAREGSGAAAAQPGVEREPVDGAAVDRAGHAVHVHVRHRRDRPGVGVGRMLGVGPHAPRRYRPPPPCGRRDRSRVTFLLIESQQCHTAATPTTSPT